MLNGKGEQTGRRLQSPPARQHSGFQDRDPRGFGLRQRKRKYEDFQDAEAAYQKRPSLWVEPLGDWGEGEVHLVEIPTAAESPDKLVPFWRSKLPCDAAPDTRRRYPPPRTRPRPSKPQR